MEETTATMMDKVVTAMAEVFSLTGEILTQITSNEILVVIFAAGMVGIGVGTFKRLKRAAR